MALLHAGRSMASLRQPPLWFVVSRTARAHAAGSRFETACVRSDPPHPGLLRGVVTPIVTSSTFDLESVDHGARLSESKDYAFAGDDGFVYSRWSNPTSDVVARAIARLEGATRGGARVLASGMAAITNTLMTSLKHVRLHCSRAAVLILTVHTGRSRHCAAWHLRRRAAVHGRLSQQEDGGAGTHGSSEACHTMC